MDRIRTYADMSGMTEDGWKELRAVYLGMCSKIDDQFGRLCAALKAAGIYDDSAIFVLSDHGDFTGDYGLVEKAQNCFEDCLTRVPLLVKPPKGVAVDPGVTDSMAELVDFYATAMELAGVTPDHDQYGKSLLPVVADRTRSVRDYAFCEGGRGPGEFQSDEYHQPDGTLSREQDVYWPKKMAQKDDDAHARATMIRSRRYKYISRTAGRDELYDLQADPGETTNRIDDPALETEKRTLQLELLKWLQRTADVVPRDFDNRFTEEMLWCKVKSIVPPGCEEDVRQKIRSGMGIGELFGYWIARQPELVALNSLDAAPAFYYDSGEPEIQWLDGWDESFLGKSDWEPIVAAFAIGGRQPVGGDVWETYPGLVSREFLEENGLALGDVMDIGLRLDMVAYGQLDLAFPMQIVGVYSGSAGQQQIYLPLAFWFDPQWLTSATPVDGGQPVGSDFTDEAGRDAYFYTYTTFSTCRFTLTSPRQLDAFRDYLQSQGISQVNQLAENRTTVVLQDSSFVETVSGLGRYVTFSRILLPVLCVVVVLLGFIISWLMINGRRMEFAIMRGLGAGRGRVFGSFFLEQAMLALAGCLAGCLVLAVTGAGLAGCLAAAALLVCYLAGCAVAVLAVGRTNLMQLLSEKE